MRGNEDGRCFPAPPQELTGMAQQVSNTVGNTEITQTTSTLAEGRRNCWIVTGYVASILTLVIVLAFYFSSYVTR